MSTNMNTNMNTSKVWAASMRGLLGKPVATPETDPSYFGSLLMMPNPDPILRHMGRADEVYRSILADPHVLGEVRSIRGSFRQLKWRVVAGADDTPSKKAAELCRAWMANTAPNPVNDWLEVMWQMSSCILTGYRPHELVWDYTDGKYLPSLVIDRPTRRFKFDAHSQPLLISQGNMMGAAVEPYQFVISRHAASIENPYGLSLLSSCFWPWTFKTGGWRYFVKFCERHGLPWPVARYPVGTGEKELDELQEALEAMLENAYALVPEGTGVELLEAKSTGSLLPQESLINLCNREISKGLTGQAMIAELQGAGARAASETAFKRQEGINESDRDIAASSMGQIFRWITLFNFGEKVPAPTLEFFKQEAASKDRAETYEIAARLGAKPSRAALLEELNIPAAKDADDELVASKFGAVPKSAADKKTEFAKPAGLRFAKDIGLDDAQVASMAALAASELLDETVFQPAMAMLAQYEADGKTLAEFEADFGKLVGQSDPTTLRELTESAIKLSYLQGRVQAIEEAQ